MVGPGQKRIGEPKNILDQKTRALIMMRTCQNDPEASVQEAALQITDIVLIKRNDGIGAGA